MELQTWHEGSCASCGACIGHVFPGVVAAAVVAPSRTTASSEVVAAAGVTPSHTTVCLESRRARHNIEHLACARVMDSRRYPGSVGHRGPAEVRRCWSPSSRKPRRWGTGVGGNEGAAETGGERSGGGGATRQRRGPSDYLQQPKPKHKTCSKDWVTHSH